MTDTKSTADHLELEAPATSDRACLERIESNLAIAEQSLQVAQEIERAPAIETTRRTSLAVSVVIPVFNERDTVVEIVRRVQAVGIHQEIILVDDFSMDGTRQILVELARGDDVRIMFHGYNRGKGAALRTGFQQASGDVVLVQDADLEYNPNDLPRLLAPIESGEADVVYGSRFLTNAAQDKSRTHRFGNWVLTQASNLATGQRLTDMETCYKVFRREVLDAIELEQNRFGFEPEITAKISRLGYRIVEVPIGYDPRGFDEGKKIGMADAASALWCIAKYGGRW
ncbi:glycosyltransferase family 2 protein [Lacipirellula limnantheis]|uniref:Undecaprenyl-phosphate 4-deoxy-4-formamido-L-arabinose transferase n=1 Tax=Lacipirellula limnantheis TaxID=2528024 RepID=A0A517TRT2_9BACT|nr:glycosyltransferase family 2 protein [Lacipirellula limnantheis]QDT71085.1 Undecaprenyl-phosphate 4-deoxy-4-formamido-L-arabinose transferase [Lacipirellula limnantheis]